jgi:hypothetical protein
MDVEVPAIEPEMKERYLNAYGVVLVGNGTVTAEIKGQNYIVCEERNASDGTDLVFKTPQELRDSVEKKLTSNSVLDSPTVGDEGLLFKPFNELVDRGEAAIQNNPPTYSDQNLGDMDPKIVTAIEKMLNSDVVPAPSVPAPAPGNAPAP